MNKQHYTNHNVVPALPLLGAPVLHSPDSPCHLGRGPAPAYRAIYEEQLYRAGRDIHSDRTVPVFPGGQGAMAELASSLRPYPTSEPAGSNASLRNRPTPTALSLDPLPYEVQFPDDIQRHVVHGRVEGTKYLSAFGSDHLPQSLGYTTQGFQVRPI